MNDSNAAKWRRKRNLLTRRHAIQIALVVNNNNINNNDVASTSIAYLLLVRVA